MNTTEKYIEKLEEYNGYLYSLVLEFKGCPPLHEDQYKPKLSQLKSSLEQEEKEQRVTAEEMLVKNNLAYYFNENFYLNTDIGHKEETNKLLQAMIDFRNSGRDWEKIEKAVSKTLIDLTFERITPQEATKIILDQVK